MYERRAEKSVVSGDEASVWWINSEAARNGKCQNGGESPIMVVVVGWFTDHGGLKGKE